MRLRYSSRSSFLPAIHAALDEQGGCSRQDESVRVLLKQQGYDGNVIVDISADDLDEFGCDWEGADETRFPARIRAAATALRDSGCAGRFNIVHTNGILTIVRLA